FDQEQIGIDSIEDFGDGIDRIHLNKTTFTALNSQDGMGMSIESEFAVVAQDSLAASSEALIVFSSGTGNMFYNQNDAGSGFGSGGHFLILIDVDSLSTDDFIVRD
nr:hypothetical protein [Pleurocapsa sp. MO_226.B13]